MHGFDVHNSDPSQWLDSILSDSKSKMLSLTEKDSQHGNNQLGYRYILEFVVFLFSHALRIKGVGGLRATPALAERKDTRYLSLHLGVF